MCARTQVAGEDPLRLKASRATLTVLTDSLKRCGRRIDVERARQTEREREGVRVARESHMHMLALAHVPTPGTLTHRGRERVVGERGCLKCTDSLHNANADANTHSLTLTLPLTHTWIG